MEGEHRAMIQSMRTQGEAEYIPGVNTEVDAPAQVTVQRQQEVVEGAEADEKLENVKTSCLTGEYGHIYIYIYFFFFLGRP